MATVEIDGPRAQKLAALQTALDVRRAGMEVKAAVKDGLPVAAAMKDPRAARLKVSDLLMAQPGWGKDTTGRFLFRSQISGSKRVDALTERQRGAIAEAC